MDKSANNKDKYKLVAVVTPKSALFDTSASISGDCSKVIF